MDIKKKFYCYNQLRLMYTPLGFEERKHISSCLLWFVSKPDFFCVYLTQFVVTVHLLHFVDMLSVRLLTGLNLGHRLQVVID